MTNAERARRWLKETWPWSLDADGPSEREVKLLAGLLDETASEARGCIKMLLRCAVPNAKEHPMMWDAWGDASEWLGEDRNRHRTPHVDLQGDRRASSLSRSKSGA